MDGRAGEGAARSVRLERRAAWGIGVLAGVVAMGPALGPGSLLNLDLVTAPEVPVPAGAWGLGPELPRRVPLYLPMAWLSQVASGDSLQKLLMVVIVAAALAGMARLAEPLPVVLRLGAGTAYALSPFLLTRLEVGHHTFALAAALLPWAIPTLLDPGRSGSRLLRWSALLGVAGAHGAAMVGIVVLAALLTGPRRRTGVIVLAVVLGQLPWAVPGAIVWLQSGAAASAADFPTHLVHPADWPALLAGEGFWQQALQLGWGSRWVPAAAGALLLVLAALGFRGVPTGWRRPLGLSGAVGLFAVTAGSLPGVDGVWDDVTGTAAGAALREAHRFLPLVQVPLLLAAAHGVERVARRGRGAVADLVRVGPAIAALLLAGPALWGLGGFVRPVAYPAEWRAARAAVHAQPGTVLALPWHLYLDISWAHGRRVLNPVPLYFGGDVLVSSDPELGSARPERGDPREPAATRLVDDVRRGRPVLDQLRALGVRWVVLLEEHPISDYDAIRREPGLRPAVEGGTLTLLEVSGWAGPARDPSGSAVGMEQLVAPLARLEGGSAATIQRAGGWGWRRGTAAARTTHLGLLEVGAGSGPLWYPPAVLVLSGDVITLCALLATFRRRREGRGGIGPP